MRLIPNAVPHLGGNEWQYLKECLDTNWVSSVGPFVERFEREVAAYVGCAHAVATVSGTAALHVALLLAGVGPGDEVLVPALTFVATANAVRYCRAEPVFMDAEPVSWGIDPTKVAEFLGRECEVRHGHVVNRATGRTVKAIVPVHLYGHPVDLDPLLDLTTRYPLALVEDAAEALGARYRGRRVGALGRLGCLSFNGNKIITSGGGGMILTNDGELACRARSLTTQARADGLEYIHHEVASTTALRTSRPPSAWPSSKRSTDSSRRSGAPRPCIRRRSPGSAAPSRLARRRGPSRPPGCTRCCWTPVVTATCGGWSNGRTLRAFSAGRSGTRCIASRCSRASRRTGLR